MINQKIADIFEEFGILLEMIRVEWKPRAYQKAATEIRALQEDIKEIYGNGGRNALDAIPFIGEHITEKIEEYLKSGHIQEYEILKKRFPMKVLELSRVEGLGPNMLRDLYDELNIRTLRQLEAAAKSHKIQKLKHFGEKIEEKILRSIQFIYQSGDRKIFGYILPLSRTILERFENLEGVKRAVVAGSIRRREETIGDIDILIASNDAERAMEIFVRMPEVVFVNEKGKTQTSVRLSNGMNASLRVADLECFGAALQYFTGNHAHNGELQKIAVSKGMKLSKYGLFKEQKFVAGKTEEEIYETLGMQFIEPELRTHTGEIEAAKKHRLPKILPYGSVRGDLQVQSEWTDGSDSIEDLAQKAFSLGREYIAITDHTRTLAITGGLDEKKFLRQWKEIDTLNAQNRKQKKKFQILKGAEVNILGDGSFDIDDSVLKKLDVVGAAVHTNMKMPRNEMTKRILKALEHPHLDILFHPTGRLIHRRPPFSIDMKEIIRAAKKNRVALEIDAYPDRSDLKDEYVRMAVEAGVKLTIDTDTHALDHLLFLELGEAIARRGWATKKDVLNTMPCQELLHYFQKKK